MISPHKFSFFYNTNEKRPLVFEELAVKMESELCEQTSCFPETISSCYRNLSQLTTTSPGCCVCVCPPVCLSAYLPVCLSYCRRACVDLRLPSSSSFAPSASPSAERKRNHRGRLLKVDISIRRRSLARKDQDKHIHSTAHCVRACVRTDKHTSVRSNVAAAPVS